MIAFFQFFQQNPVRIALFGAYNAIFAILSYAAIVWCLFSHRKNGWRWLALMASLAVCVAAEWFQLEMQFAKMGFSDYPRWGIPRYFGVMSPLVWIFAAKLIRDLLAVKYLRYAVAVLALGFGGWLVYQSYFVDLPACYCGGARQDVLVAAQRAAEVIRADYRGPARQARRKFVYSDYYTTRRPVVFSDFSAVAWLLRGQSEGAEVTSGHCPYADDYLFLRVGTGYGKMKSVDSRKYDYVGSVEGVGTEWRLFRRKTTKNAGVRIGRKKQ